MFKIKAAKFGQACFHCSRLTLISMEEDTSLVRRNPLFLRECCISNEGNPLFRGNPAYVMKGVQGNPPTRLIFADHIILVFPGIGTSGRGLPLLNFLLLKKYQFKERHEPFLVTQPMYLSLRKLQTVPIF